MILLVSVASAADVLWFVGNGGDEGASVAFVEGTLDVEATATWPTSLDRYRLVFLVIPQDSFDTFQVAALAGVTPIVVGDYGGYAGPDALNGLLGDLGLEARFDGLDRDCVTPRVATATSHALATDAPHPTYICGDSLSLGSSGSAIYHGESGGILAAEEAGVVMLADSNLLVDDIPLNRDNTTFVLNLYVATCAISADWEGDGADAVLCGGDDCDDGDPAVNPAAMEVCNGVDDNCDGAVDEAGATGEPTWYRDRDGDGAGDDRASTLSCNAPPGFVPGGGDCDDGLAAIRPGVPETCDGVDEDCDGQIDNDPIDPLPWYLDADLDGNGGPESTTACAAPRGYSGLSGDCDDTDRFVHPGAAEHCDGRDEDCDGTVDELAVDAPTAFSDYDDDGAGGGDLVIVQCSVPDGYALVEGDCDDHDATVFPGADELCDELDNDCDLVVDEDAVDADAWYTDADDDGWGDDVLVTDACEAPSGTTSRSGDCDDADPAVSPGELELCDGLDQDCDHAIDDNLDVTPWYEDKDGDGVGVQKGAVIDCAQPEGYVAVYGDCNDADANRTTDCTIEHERPPKQEEEPAGCGCATARGLPVPFFLALLLRRRRG